MDDLPAEIMVWKSNPGLDHLGTWAIERYPEEAVAYVPLETCNARVAAMVGAAADGYPCQRCGHQIIVDAVVAHDVWERIKPEGSGHGGGLLCANCIVEAVGKKEAWTAVRLVDADVQAALDAMISRAVAAERERCAALFTAKPWTWNAHEIHAAIAALAPASSEGDAK